MAVLCGSILQHTPTGLDVESKAVLRRYWTPPGRATPRVWHWATLVGDASRLVVFAVLGAYHNDLTVKRRAECVRALILG